MEMKRSSESQVSLHRMVLPEDTNVLNGLYGGKLMEWIDNVASIVAAKHARKQCVTGSVDSMFFLSPINLGDIVHLDGRITYVTRETMEVEISVFSEDTLSGQIRFTTSAHLTYVAIDQNRKPTPVPGLIVETDEEMARWKDGEERSKNRKKLLEQVRERKEKMTF